MPAIMVSTIVIHDADAFGDYLARSKEIAGRYGAELLFRGQRRAALNGTAPEGPLIVIAKFPDAKAVDAWHSAPDYKDLIALRDRASTQTMTVYDGL